MHKVTMQDVNTILSRLIREALEGKEVVPATGKDPLGTLSPRSKPARSRKIEEDPGIVEYISEDLDGTSDDLMEYLP